MAMKISYPEVPEVFSNGTRVKGIKDADGNIIWPLQMNIDSPFRLMTWNDFSSLAGAVETEGVIMTFAIVNPDGYLYIVDWPIVEANTSAGQGGLMPDAANLSYLYPALSVARERYLQEDSALDKKWPLFRCVGGTGIGDSFPMTFELLDTNLQKTGQFLYASWWRIPYVTSEAYKRRTEDTPIWWIDNSNYDTYFGDHLNLFGQSDVVYEICSTDASSPLIRCYESGYGGSDKSNGWTVLPLVLDEWGVIARQKYANINFDLAGGHMDTSFGSGWERTTSGFLMQSYVPEKSGNYFTGWLCDSNGLTFEYNNEENIFYDPYWMHCFVGDDVTFTAQWESSGDSSTTYADFMSLMYDAVSIGTSDRMYVKLTADFKIVGKSNPGKYGYTVLQDNTSYFLVYDKTDALGFDTAAIGDVFYNLTGTIRKYNATIQMTTPESCYRHGTNSGGDDLSLFEIQTCASDINSKIRGLWTPDNTSGMAPVPMAIEFLLELDRTTFIEDGQGRIYITLPDGDTYDTNTVQIQVIGEDDIVDYLALQFEEYGNYFYLYGYMIYWYGNYRTFLLVDVTINENL